jgi:hypothetical protein
MSCVSAVKDMDGGNCSLPESKCLEMREWQLPLKQNQWLSADYRFSVFFRGISGFHPALPATIHGFHVAVAHFLKIVGGESGAKPAAAVEHQFRGSQRNALLDVPLDDSLPEMNGAGQMATGPFALFADINQNELFAGIHAALDVRNIGFLDPLLGVVDER